MFSSISKKLFALISFIIISILLSGCGVWRNFTTYFNTYYNAKTLFDQTEEAYLKQRTDIFKFREDQQNTLQTGQFNSSQNFQQQSGSQQTGAQRFGEQTNQQLNNQQQFNQQQFNQQGVQSTSLASGNLTQDFTKVIEKCSKILQYEQSSGYFPDALFITGKALYYQKEYSKAQRKFQELTGLGNTNYLLEGKLWLAKTDLQLRSFDEGLKLIEEVKEESLKEDEDKIYLDAVVTKISFFIFREEFTKAVNECKSFLEISSDDEMKALVSFQLGKIYQRMRDDQNALVTYAEVLKYGPTHDVELKSRLEHARLLKSLDRIDESKNELEEMESQGKFKSNLDEIYLELCDIYVDQGEVKRAIDLYRFVDTTYKQLPTGGIASFRLADVYWRKDMNLDSAKKYYAKVVQTPAPFEIKKTADIQAKNLNRYFGYKEECSSMSMQLIYLNDHSKFLRDSIEYDIAYKEFLDDNQKLLDQQKSQTGANFSSEEQQRQQLLIQQQAEQQKKLKKRQENQRLGIVEPVSLKELIASQKAKKPEIPKMTADSLKGLLAVNLYNQGSLFFSELDYPDSAFQYFSRILSDFSDKPIIPQVLYSLGTYYETQNDTLKADSLFKVIYDKYPDDKMRNPAGIKLGLIKKEEKKNADRINDPAEKHYIAAEDLYFQKKYTEAIDSFKVIYKKFPTSGFAPKALCYIGLIYEDDLRNNDSAAVAYGIISRDFLLDPISKEVMGKYHEYKTEKERIQKEIEAKRLNEEQKKKAEEEKLKEEQNKTAVANQQPGIQDQKTVMDSSSAKKDLTLPVQKDSTMKNLVSPAVKDSTRKKLIER